MAAGYLSESTHPWLWRPLNRGGGGKAAQMFQLGVQMAQHKRAMAYKEQILAAEQEAKMQTAEGHAALGQVLARGAGRWTDPEVKREFWETASRYPALMKHPSFRELTQNFELADTAKARADLFGQRQEGALDLATEKHMLKLDEIEAKYAEMEKFAVGSQERKDAHAVIQNDLRMLRDSRRPRSVESDRFNLSKSDEISYRNELAVLKDAFEQGLLREKGQTADSALAVYERRRQDLEDKYKSRSRVFNPQAAPVTTPTNTPAPAAPEKRIKVKSPDGRIGSIPESQVEAAKQKGYILAE